MATTDNTEATEVETQVDSINLEQALVDFEVANSRVIDLTGRLTSLSREAVRLRHDLADAQLELARSRDEARALRSELDTIKTSLAYKSARGLGDLRARVRIR